MVHRSLRKPVLPLLSFVPVLTLAVMNPGVALAEDATPQEDSIPQGVLTLFEDSFSYEDANSSEDASDSAYNYSLDTFDDTIAMHEEAQSSNEASKQSASQVPTSTGSQPYSYELAQSSASDSVMIAEKSGTENYSAQRLMQSASLISNSDKSNINQTNLSTNADGSLGTSIVNPSVPSGSIVIYDPHQALLQFTVSTGGTIVQGTETTVSAGDGVEVLSQEYDNSLMGNSSGATAIPDAGYHFVYWLDTSTGKPLSTSVNFIPDRPASGWPVQWVIQAVFALDVYQIILDPNGGVSTGGGGGGSSGAVYLGEVVPGSEYQLPDNGSTDVSFAKAGNTFAGWNAVAHPDSQSASGFSITDGQFIDSEIENSLENLGYLITGKNIPTLILYAQWIANKVAIEYRSDSTGGTVSLYSDRKGSGASYTSETLMADTGIHPDKNVSAGPEGAVAIVDTGYHFSGWTVIGSDKELSSSEASNANLSPAVVSRISYYPSTVPNIGEYHGVSFGASFAPNTYIVAYDANGGTGAVDSSNYTYGSSAITAAADGVTREGYTLSGWNLSAQGNSVSIGLGSSIDSSVVQSMVASGLVADKDDSRATLYAQWTPVSSTDPDDPDNPDNPSEDNGQENQNGSEEQGGNGFSDNNSQPGGTSTGGRGSSSFTDIISGVVAGAASNELRVIDPAAAVANAAAEIAVGILATSSVSANSVAADGSLIVRESYSDMGGSSFAGYNNDGNILSSLMSPEGMQEAGATVAAVAAVGALASLVGVGVSVAGAVMVGAVTIGTGSAIGLTSAVDLAADLAVASAAGAAAGAASKRKRKEEDDGEEEKKLESQE